MRAETRHTRGRQGRTMLRPPAAAAASVLCLPCAYSLLYMGAAMEIGRYVYYAPKLEVGLGEWWAWADVAVSSEAWRKAAATAAGFHWLAAGASNNDTHPPSLTAPGAAMAWDHTSRTVLAMEWLQWCLLVAP